MSNGHAPSALEAFGKALGGADGSSAELASADAQAALSTALVESLVQFDKSGLRELVFLQEYMGQQAGLEFVGRVVRYKRHQTPGALKRLVEAIKALSLHEFMRGMNLNIGGK